MLSMYCICISVQALTPSLNPSLLEATIGTPMTLTIPTHQLAIFSILDQQAPFPSLNCIHCNQGKSWPTQFQPNHFYTLPQPPPCACHPVGNPTHFPLSHPFCR